MDRDRDAKVQHPSFSQVPPAYQQAVTGNPNLYRFDATPRFPIEAAATRANVPVITLRAWERAYSIPSPTGSESASRLYSARDIAAISWIRSKLPHQVSVRQAIAELSRLEFAYVSSQNPPTAQILLPPRVDLDKLREKLFQAITTLNKASVTRILDDAFVTYPATIVCTDLLQPVACYISEICNAHLVPPSVRSFMQTMIHQPYPYLIEACFSSKEASQHLARIAEQTASVEQKAEKRRLQDFPPLESVQETLIKAIIKRDASAIYRILETTRLYYSAEDIYTYLLHPAIAQLTPLRKQERLTQEEETFGIKTLHQYLSSQYQTLPHYFGNGPLLLVGSGPYETRETDALMLALRRRCCGFPTVYVGRITSSEVMLQHINQFHPAIVILYTTGQSCAAISAMIRTGGAVSHAKRNILFCSCGEALDQPSSGTHGSGCIYLGATSEAIQYNLEELLRLYPSLSTGQIEELMSPNSLLANFQGEAVGTRSSAAQQNAPPPVRANRLTAGANLSIAPPNAASYPATQSSKKTSGWKGTPFYPGWNDLRRALPGLLLVVLPISVLAEILWIVELAFHKTFFVDIFIAGTLALIAGNIWTIPERLQAGLTFSTRWFLRLGIICSGLKFSYLFLLQSGVRNLAIVVTTVVIALVISMVVGRIFKVNPHIAALIGTGTGICGISAIMASSPAVGARDEETAVALGTILFCGTLGLLIYPIIGGALHISATDYGSWTGATIHDLPQLLAAAQQGGGATALQAALFVKLIRISFLALVIPFLHLFFGIRKRREASQKGQGNPLLEVIQTFPLFVIGFFLVVLLNTIISVPAWLSGPLATWSTATFPTTISSVFLMFTITGICARVTRSAIKVAGIRAIMLGLVTWGIQSAAVLLVISLTLH